MYFNAFQYSATLTFIPLKSSEDNASEYGQVLKEKGSMAQTGLTKTVKHLASHRFHHTLKKRKDSLEGSLARVLFTGKLEFPKILVPRLPQNSSNVNTECARKSKQLYSLCYQLLAALIHIHFIIVIIICF